MKMCSVPTYMVSPCRFRVNPLEKPQGGRVLSPGEMAYAAHRATKSNRRKRDVEKARPIPLVGFSVSCVRSRSRVRPWHATIYFVLTGVHDYCVMRAGE